MAMVTITSILPVLRILPLLLLAAEINCVVPGDAEDDGKELRYVQAIWRHGDRAPSRKPYPGDPYDESYWPRGWSQLTNLGMRQLKEVGKFFRHRYVNAANFISGEFNKKEVFILSSESERALTSAQAMLNGLFPPRHANQSFEPQLGWQPIAVHSSGYGDADPLLKVTDFHCPRYNKLLRPVKQETEHKLKTTYSELFTYLKRRVFRRDDDKSTPPSSKVASGGEEGLPISRVLKLNDINRELAHGLHQPAWVWKSWPQYGNKTTLELVTEMHRVKRASEFDKQELAYLRGGYLLGDWMQRAKRLAAGARVKKPATKMVLYSSHDGTLQALLHNLGVSKGEPVPYAACIIMEVYRLSTGAHVAKFLYRRNGELIELSIDGCQQEECPVDKLAKLLKRKIIYREEQLHKECGITYCEKAGKGVKKEKKKKKEE